MNANCTYAIGEVIDNVFYFLSSSSFKNGGGGGIHFNMMAIHEKEDEFLVTAVP